MSKYCIIGTGRQGTAALYDLIKFSKANSILLIDSNAESIKSCRSIYIEISKGDVYKGGAQWNDIVKFLKKHNFSPAWQPKHNHVDVLFVKENFISK